ncbi:MAG: RagB/SusD family nutrient uptake outer membrane protein [Sphingobacteriia bacterium]|nr:RagB/SusD family nutrient uptake outer membrane protein [Sphingobacteriia bacterium]
MSYLNMILKAIHRVSKNRLEYFKLKNGGYGIYIIIPCISLMLTGCKKLVSIDPPPTVLLSETVYNSDATAIAAISSIYTKMAGNYTSQVSLYPGYSADEFNNFSTGITETAFFTNSLNATNVGTKFWPNSYNYIYQANALLEGLQQSTGVSNPIKSQLNGEAKFLRALLYFYLVNLYGDLPLILSTNYSINSIASRTSKDQVFSQIVSDLKDAESSLNVNYLAGDGVTVSNEKLRPTKAAARSLLARVLIYQKDWSNAEAYATTVISSGVYSLNTTDLTKVWAKNSSEAIWQISTNPSYNTYEGNQFIAIATPQYVSLSSSLLGAFESGDKRRVNWVGSVSVGTNTYYFPYKYRVQNSTTVSEYVMMLRYAELFLIRAEAYANQNKLSQAITDLNTIRSRAGLPALAASLSQSQILGAIEQERRIELFSEWGDRWLFLKRTGRIDTVMSVATPLKGNNSWNTNYQLYPIPQAELTADPNLTQNPGY